MPGDAWSSRRRSPTPYALVDEARPDGDDRDRPLHRHRRPFAPPRAPDASDGAATAASNDSITLAVLVARPPRRRASAARGGRRRGRRRDLDVAEGERRDRRRTAAGRGRQVLAHHLAVHLARRRHVDHDVAADRRGAAEPVPGASGRLPAVVALERRPVAECVARRGDLPLRERARSTGVTWQRPQMPRPPHTRVEVDAESPGGVEHRRARRRPRRRARLGVNTTAASVASRLARVGSQPPLEAIVPQPLRGVRRRRGAVPSRRRPARAAVAVARACATRRHSATSSCAVVDAAPCASPGRSPAGTGAASSTWCRSRARLARSPAPGCRARR